MIAVMNAKEAEKIKRRLLSREDMDCSEQQEVVDQILKDVKERGDAALFEYTGKLDRFAVDSGTIEVSQQTIKQAYTEVEVELVEILRQAAENIRYFHEKQRREDWFVEREDGAVLGQLYLPIENAGVYVPGGTAAYPSSVLMNIIPAKCAGVQNICVATPAMDGKINPVTLVAADIAGADRIFQMGGAQAVAAFAYGTESVPKMDKVTGPGNIYVALAKKSVYGAVGIDMIAGPSEILVIADQKANVRYVAADFLSQAEHDALSACILVTDSKELGQAVQREIKAQLQLLGRTEIIESAIRNYGTIILCDDLEECAKVSNRIAPEHLEICVESPKALLPKIRHAGSIFLGEYSPEPLGDYFTGPNHVLPTNGTARFSSPLNVDDFQKKSSVIYYTKEAFQREYKKVQKLAETEGLMAHARSASIRFEV